jgi:hypothetical protein
VDDVVSRDDELPTAVLDDRARPVTLIGQHPDGRGDGALVDQLALGRFMILEAADLVVE